MDSFSWILVFALVFATLLAWYVWQNMVRSEIADSRRVARMREGDAKLEFARESRDREIAEFHNSLKSMTQSLRDRERALSDAQRLYEDLRRESERRRRSETILSGVISNAISAVVLMDAEGRVTEWNDAAVRLFGYSRKQALGQRVSDLIIPPEYRAAHERAVRRFIESGTSSILNRCLRLSALHADGHLVPVEISVAAFRVEGVPVFNAFIREV